jgi:hypothetical protein
MSVRMKMDESERVLIEFRGHMDDEKLARCRAAYAQLPRLRWKDVTVVLDSGDAFAPGVRDLLRDLSARASRCRLKLVGSGREAAHA